ncbi:hypothetical protein A3754_21095 [Alcanivorax sp. HI0083]|nr:hypothetical protein A3754_21095 [Alcanivorax sp. HI0083]
MIDAADFLPQHRERIVIVGFRKDLNISEGFSLADLDVPEEAPLLADIVDKKVPDKYILTDKLWAYLQNYAKKHQAAGNGFGFGLVESKQKRPTRTLSARYYKDGSEILLSRGQNKNPRRLTPRECARLMGFDKPGESDFRIPVSDTQAYKQFGNSVAVPVFEAVAREMHSRILDANVKGKKKKYKIKQPDKGQMRLLEEKGKMAGWKN